MLKLTVQKLAENDDDAGLEEKLCQHDGLRKGTKWPPSGQAAPES
jgi:hypothetical protein